MSLLTTGPVWVWCSLLLRVSTPGVDCALVDWTTHSRARVDTADMLLVSAYSFGLDETGYPPPLKDGATASSTLSTRGCLMAFT
ncbi:hypothetical protein PR003_g24731 [Phytophthora rubi]|uniref:Secreted protein n=1 Tax=Phytophthora rubi TaxID=129364 RepID=A0A6A3IA16_9STRA|nr:hypothetical protein PR001_g24425 [Phytophthora rubi]KAE8979956.1 hypothetical protein PR002_g24269 [Phytophthora rubi]KAE9292536.1 hypothetical protein PR003_g24731 [Phytophthora rubi]